ncbi:MAG: preprotein translocase subunit SecG, partial [Salinisphaera sp.]|nr:preprotein translocase subunit SecG [Salinisphaera sp.]
MLYTILVIVQVLVAVGLIGLILMQHGKGADAGAAFGSGASGTVFGAQGSANFLSRVTAGLAALFFVISLTLAYLVGGAPTTSSESVVDQLQVPGSELFEPEAA